MSEGVDEKRMKLRYAGVCRVCDADLAARVEANYERATRTVRCLDCSPAAGPASPRLVEEGAPRQSRDPGPIDPGTPGGSARRAYERRQAKRETRIREKHPKLGGLALAVTEDPQSTKAWDTGAVVEEQVGQKLNELAPSVRGHCGAQVARLRVHTMHCLHGPSAFCSLEAWLETRR